MKIVATVFVTLIAISLYYISKTSVAYRVHNRGIVLITGASTGIGRAASEYLAHKYQQYVIFAGVRKQSDFDEISRQKKSNLIPLILDVTSSNPDIDSQNALDIIKAYKRKYDIPFIALVNNAGIANIFPIEYHPMNDARQIFEVNFFGVLKLIQLFLPLLRESQGRIITVSSTAGYIGAPLKGVYAASKFAIEGLSDALRREVAQFGISISLLEPAFVKSEILKYVKSVDLTAVCDSSTMTSLYNRTMHNSAEYAHIAHPKADDPIVTSQAIEHAITSEYALTRYRIANENGRPAWYVALWFWLLSDRFEDCIMF